MTMHNMKKEVNRHSFICDEHTAKTPITDRVMVPSRGIERKSAAADSCSIFIALTSRFVQRSMKDYDCS